MSDFKIFLDTDSEAANKETNENTISFKNSSSQSYLSACENYSSYSNCAGEIEIISSEFDSTIKPISVKGYILKQRRSPMKGFHKRFVYLTDGCFTYSKSKSQMEMSIYLKDVVPLMNIAITIKEPKIFIDVGSIVHKFKFKSTETCKKWTDHLLEHKRYSRVIHADNMNDSLFNLLRYDPNSTEIFDRWTSGANINDTPTYNKNENGSTTSHIKELDQLEKLHASMSKILTSINTRSSLHIPRSPSSGRLDSNTSLEDSSHYSDNDSQNHLVPTKHNKLNILSRNRSKRISPSQSNVGSSMESWKIQAEKFMTLSKQFIATASEISHSGSNQDFIETTDMKIQELNRKISELYSKNLAYEETISKMKSILSTVDSNEFCQKSDHVLIRYQTLNQTLCSSSSSGSFYDAQENRNVSGSEISNFSDEESYADNAEAQDRTAPLPNLSDQATLKDAENKRRRASEASFASRNSLGYRTILSAKRPTECEDFNMVNLLYKNIGTDLSKIRLPVILNEPLSALQRLCEDLEYSQLLDEACSTKDPLVRMALVSAFAVSMYSSSAYRASTKPFNPILGETFECIRDEKGWKYMAEQVSHHPPSAVCHCIHDNWIFHQELTLKNKFWGKCLEAIPEGYLQVDFKKLNESYTWSKVASCIYNLMGSLSKRTIENYGTCLIECPETNVTCKLSFHKTDWSGKNNFLVTGTIQNKSDSEKKLNVHGYSNRDFYIGEKNSADANLIWVMNPMPENYNDYYGYSQFAVQLNEEPDPIQLLNGAIPITDSRLRPDQRYLEVGQVEAAENEKVRIEEEQRRRINQMSKDGVTHQPRWFKPVKTKKNGVRFEFDESYWSIKAKSAFKSQNIQPIW